MQRLTFIFALLPVLAGAAVPEPGNIYYGLASDPFGLPYQPGLNTKVQLVRIVGTVDNPLDTVADDDVIIAESEILSPAGATGVNFVLRPSQDDGSGTTRYASTAARLNDTVAIYIIDQGVRFPVMSVMNNAVTSNAVPNIGARGSINVVDVRAMDDYDGNGLSDTWESWFFGGNGVDPNGDEDGDGLSNLSEFVASTNPLVFDVLDISLENAHQVLAKNSNLVQVDVPRQSGRRYTLEWSYDLVNWSAVPTSRLSGALQNMVDVTGTGPQVFFRYNITRLPAGN